MGVRPGMMESRLEPIVESSIAGDEAGVDECHQEFRIVDLQFSELLDFAHLVSHDQPEIPQRMQDGAQRVLLSGAEVAAEQDEQIDVRMQKKLAPAIPANGDDGDGLWGLGRGREKLPHDRVEAVGKTGQRRAAAMAAQDVVLQFTTCFVELDGKRERHGGAPHTLYRSGAPPLRTDPLTSSS